MFEIEKVRDNILEISNNPKYLDPSTIKDQRWFKISNGIFLDLEAIKYLRNAVEEINKDGYIKNNVTSKLLEDKIISIIKDSFEIDTESKSHFVDVKLNDLKSDIKKGIMKWNFHVPIYNLSIENSFMIGKVHFYNFDKNIGEKFKKLFENSFDQDEDLTEIEVNINEECKFFIKKNIGSTVAEIKLKGIFESSHQTAFHQIRLTLNVLKLFAQYDSDEYAIKGEIKESIERITLGYSEDESGDKNYFRLWQRTGPKYKHEINDEIIEIMKENGLDELDRILKLDNPTKLEKRILTAIYWFGESMNIKIPEDQNFIFREKMKDDGNLEYFNLGDKFLKLSNALETLIVFDKNEPIVHSVSERCAFLLNDNYPKMSKLEINKIVKNLYNTRSRIVHNGDTFVSKIDLISMIHLIRDLIFKIIEVKCENSLKNPEELRNYLEEMKFSK